MAKVTAKLRVLDLRGETVHTRWGHVTFDRDGLSELEVEEDELPMLRAMQPFSWLAADHKPAGAEEPSEAHQEAPGEPQDASDAPPPPPGADAGPFDVTDADATPPQGVKKPAAARKR